MVWLKTLLLGIAFILYALVLTVLLCCGDNIVLVIGFLISLFGIILAVVGALKKDKKVE